MPGDRGRPGGFTLIELVVVLAILGLVLAMTVPFLTGRTAAGTLPAATEEIRAALRAARSAAISEARTVAFRADPALFFALVRFEEERLAGERLAASGASLAKVSSAWRPTSSASFHMALPRCALFFDRASSSSPAYSARRRALFESLSAEAVATSAAATTSATIGFWLSE